MFQQNALLSTCVAFAVYKNGSLVQHLITNPYGKSLELHLVLAVHLEPGNLQVISGSLPVGITRWGSGITWLHT